MSGIDSGRAEILALLDDQRTNFLITVRGIDDEQAGRVRRERTHARGVWSST
ncbi:hypothetical protein GS934_17720 [Rhodococcus hoagii]|nr:hypothetical protein [Prescottella equi]NKZ88227.1 hypothetical protein [Prescottella equi]